MMHTGNIRSTSNKSPGHSATSRLFVVCAILWVSTSSFLTAAAQPADSEEPTTVRVLNLPEVLFRYTPDDLPDHFSNLPQSFLDAAASHVVTDAGATLGRVLFYDRSLSQSGTISCASCHVQKSGFSDPRRFSVGHDGRAVSRNSMSLINLRYSLANQFFWDQRARGLKQQVLMPIENEVEMGHKLPDLVRQLQADSLYPPLFRSAFGSDKVTRDRIATALAMFVSSIVSYRSPFDEGRAVVDSVLDDFPNFTAQQNLGKRQFFEAGCASCHLSSGQGAHVDEGISEDSPPFDERASIRQSAVFQIEGAVVNGVDSDDPANDAGAYSVTGRTGDLGAFRSPSLRNVEVTGPYMHDGRFPTLDSVVEHYNWSVKPHPNLDPRLRFAVAGIAIPESQKVALVEFLKTLTDHQLLQDSKFNDPFLRKSDDDRKPVQDPSE